MVSTVDEERSGAVGYGLLALAVAVVGSAGYAGYVVYPRFGLPAGAGAGLLVLAAAAGVASFFSPCAFPLLVTLLARETGAEGREPRGRPLVFAAALAAGAVLFLLVVGTAISAGGAAVLREVTFTSTTGRVVRIAVGSALVLLGLFQSGAIPVRLFAPAERRLEGLLQFQAGLRRDHPTFAFGVFGFVYLLAGVG